MQIVLFGMDSLGMMDSLVDIFLLVKMPLLGMGKIPIRTKLVLVQRNICWILIKVLLAEQNLFWEFLINLE